MKKYFITWLLTSLLASSHCYAIQHIQFSCPFSIITKQSIANEVSGYESNIDNSSHFWQSVTFYDGKPSQMASLAPQRSNKNRTDWSFSMSDTIYVSCGYNQTSVSIYKPLPRGVHACHVTYETLRKSTVGALPQVISCN